MKSQKKITVLALAALLVIGLSTVLVVKAIACEEGCTPGYWKNIRKHAAAWAATRHFNWGIPYTPDMTLVQIFDPYKEWPPGIASLKGDTLLEALNYHGGPGLEGAARIMFRHAVAGLLNGAHPGVAYFGDGYVVGQVRGLLRATNGDEASDVALTRDALLALAGFFSYFNENLPCPLDWR